MNNFYRLIQGDCLKVLPKLEMNSVDLVVTDPPYGFDRFKTDDEAHIRLTKWAFVEIKRVLKIGGFAFIFSGTKDILNLAEMIPLKFQRLLWMYKPNDCTFPWRGWLLKSEAILVFSNGEPKILEDRKPYRHDCYIHTKVGQEGVEGHPSVKPLAIITDLVTRCPKDGTVLDPFLGSGTTMFACQNVARNCIGIEINPEYCNITMKRCFGRTFFDREVKYTYDVFDEKGLVGHSRCNCSEKIVESIK